MTPRMERSGWGGGGGRQLWLIESCWYANQSPFHRSTNTHSLITWYVQSNVINQVWWMTTYTHTHSQTSTCTHFPSFQFLASTHLGTMNSVVEREADGEHVWLIFCRISTYLWGALARHSHLPFSYPGPSALLTCTDQLVFSCPLRRLPSSLSKELKNKWRWQYFKCTPNNNRESV